VSRWFLILAILVLARLDLVWGDHPNEGSVTLAELLTEAENNNFDIKQAKASLQSQEALVQRSSSGFMPEVSIEGGPVSMRFDDQRSHGTSLYGRAEWNLYRGGADRSNLEKTRISRDLEKQRSDSVRLRVRREVARLYYEILFIAESLALKERAISLNSEQMKMAVAKRNSGFTSQADVLEFELRDSALRSDLVLLNQEKEQKSRELATVLGRSSRDDVLDVKGHLKRDSETFSLESVLERMSQQNLQLIESKADLALTELDKRITLSEFFPKVDVEALYGRINTDDQLFREDDNYSVMLKLSVPLFSGLSTVHGHRSNRSRVVAQKMNLHQASLNMEAEARNTISQIKMLNQRLDLEEKNLARSEQYYKTTLSEYKRGVKNSPDMVGASERLLEARIRNLEYRRDLQLAKIKILNLINQDIK